MMYVEQSRHHGPEREIQSGRFRWSAEGSGPGGRGRGADPVPLGDPAAVRGRTAQRTSGCRRIRVAPAEKKRRRRLGTPTSVYVGTAARRARGRFSPELATGDGALGFWKALDEIFPKTRRQRCWVHKTANVQNCRSGTRSRTCTDLDGVRARRGGEGDGHLHGAQARGPQRCERCLPLQITRSRRTPGIPADRGRLGTGGPSRRPPSAGCADQRSAFPAPAALQLGRWYAVSPPDTGDAPNREDWPAFRSPSCAGSLRQTATSRVPPPRRPDRDGASTSRCGVVLPPSGRPLPEGLPREASRPPLVT